MIKYATTIHFDSAAGWPMMLIRRPNSMFPAVVCRTGADGHSEAADSDHDDALAMTDAIAAACIVDLDAAADLLRRFANIT